LVFLGGELQWRARKTIRHPRKVVNRNQNIVYTSLSIFSSALFLYTGPATMMFDEPVQFSDEEDVLDTPEGNEGEPGELLAVIPSIVQRKSVIWGTSVRLLLSS
jgi:hypothetical protein